jgi:sn-glycerol 3-phosphate transport system permease protein
MTGSSARWLARGLLTLSALLTLSPLVYQVGISFTPEGAIYQQPLLPLSWPPTLDNYRRIFAELPVLRYLFNSVAFTLGVTLGQLLIAVPAAFAFSYYTFRLREALFALVLVSLMVPFVVTYLPNYLLLSSWGLLNTLPGLILPMIASGYGIFLLRQHFKSFPRAVLEAALIDGASSWQLLWRVLLPTHAAAIGAVGVYVAITTWNQYVWPLLVAGRPDMHTLTVAVPRYASGEGGGSWGALMAAAVVATLPTVLLYLVMRKQLLKTFAEGAVKG